MSSTSSNQPQSVVEPLVNQTRFSEQEPWLESEWTPPTPEPDPTLAIPKPWWRQKRIWVVAVAGILVLIVSSWWMISSSPEQPAEPDLSVVQPNTKVTTSFDKRLDEIGASLQEADPSEDFLPLPPVILDIALDRSQP